MSQLLLFVKPLLTLKVSSCHKFQIRQFKKGDTNQVPTVSIGSPLSPVCDQVTLFTVVLLWCTADDSARKERKSLLREILFDLYCSAEVTELSFSFWYGGQNVSDK